MLRKNGSFSLCSPAQTQALPGVHYDLNLIIEILPDQRTNAAGDYTLNAIVELRLQQRYKLYIEPFVGYTVSTEEDFLVSPELVSQFKIPLVILSSNYTLLIDQYVSEQLRLLLVDPHLCEILKPHIQSHALATAQGMGFLKEFKLSFSLKLTKIDLANKQECDRIGGCFRKRRM